MPVARKNRNNDECNERQKTIQQKIVFASLFVFASLCVFPEGHAEYRLFTSTKKPVCFLNRPCLDGWPCDFTLGPQENSKAHAGNGPTELPSDPRVSVDRPFNIKGLIRRRLIHTIGITTSAPISMTTRKRILITTGKYAMSVTVASVSIFMCFILFVMLNCKMFCRRT